MSPVKLLPISPVRTINQGRYRSSLIEGYASRQSVRTGETLDFFVSTDPARRFVIDLYHLHACLFAAILSI